MSLPPDPFWAYAGAAFLAGSLPSAYLMAKAVAGKDIRQHGSGNVGATNAFRVLGKGPGIVVFALDFAKGYLPVLAWMRTGQGGEWAVWIGLAGVLGHVFTPCLGFRGGKGVATGAGALSAALLHFFLLALPVWALIFVFTRIVSLASLAAIGAVFVMTLLFGVGPVPALGMLCLVLLTTWTHRSNIQRLLKGEEKKIV